MAVTREGKTYMTIAEAKEHFGVAEKTIYGWIKKGLIPEPAQLDHGARSVYVFDEPYFRRADAALRRHRESKRRGN